MWCIVYLTCLSLSAFAALTTSLTAFKWSDISSTAAQFLVFSLFLSDFCWAVFRIWFYSLVVLDPNLTNETIGVRGFFLEEKRKVGVSISTIVLLGDSFLLCSWLLVIAITFELRRLISKTIDRGVVIEHLMIKRYLFSVATITFIFFLVAEITMVFNSGLDRSFQGLLMFENAVVTTTIAFTTYIVVFLYFRKNDGRGWNESASLIYERTKHLMYSYGIIALPNCIILTVQLSSNGDMHSPVLFGIGNAVYYLVGVVNAIVMGSSQQCCFRILRPFMPVHLQQELLDITDRNSHIQPPSKNVAIPVSPPKFLPVFVFTDIESSTALWSKFPNSMPNAQALHDDLLREELVLFRGYEITTCGDAFQLAFNDVIDAVLWCIEVQLKLLQLKWPDELRSEPSTKPIVDLNGKVIYNGLRVRMGIHLGDSKVVSTVHHVTHKTVFAGASELIARAIGDLGKGGQILISEEAAKICDLFLKNGSLGSPERLHFALRPMRDAYLDEIETSISLSEVVPKILEWRWHCRT